jgi:fibronectin type 3 domain-containing protein
LLVIESQADAVAPGAPFNLSLTGKTIAWHAAGGDCFVYRIYRSTIPNFSPSIASYLCFVAQDKTSFTDSENDYADEPKRGIYYYRVTAVDKAGNESPASKALAVKYTP